MSSTPHAEAIAGCILGTAVGDAIGLPYEALSPRRARRMFGAPTQHRLLFGHGMVSDDTEHTWLVAQALCASAGELDHFRRHLAWGMRWWILGLPAGIGFATLRAILKLWLGFSPTRSGVRSAGNGPAMRCALLGAAILDSRQLVDLVRAATRITHTDPRAFSGALAVALAARQSAQQEHDGERLIADLVALAKEAATEDMAGHIALALRSVDRAESTAEFATQIGCAKGVSGFVVHTVPVAIHAWLSFPHDYAKAIESTIRCGGDTDTVAAIVGGIVGAGVGTEGLPFAWKERLFEWPRSTSWMEALARSVSGAVLSSRPTPSPRYQRLGVPARNLLFIIVVLAHVLRRMLPPY